jgi:hypothetical protein
MEKIVKKWDWKTWAIIALGGAAIIAGGAFVMQSKHAVLGRQVHRNVTKFLVDHGSQVHSGVISGGLVSAPMKTNVAVNSTVVSMLNNYNEMMANAPAGSGFGSPELTQESGVNTGMGGVQGRSAIGGNAPGASLNPPPGTPQPAGLGSTARTIKPSAHMIKNPTDGVRDDGGFATRTKEDITEYNPNEFSPQGPKPSSDVDLFAGDGIPSTGSGRPAAAPVAGYE